MTTITGNARSKGIDETEFRQILKIELPTRSKENIIDTIRQLEKIDGIKSAEPNYFGQAGAVPPSTTNYTNQWGIDGTTGIFGISARDAWDITTGSQNVRVGVMDTGIAAHNDLNSNMVAGWDFTGSGNTGDLDSHGTHCAGIIGAVGTNNGGATGVNWNVSLVPLRIATTGGWPIVNVIAALEHARDIWNTSQRIHIINFSGWKFPNSSALRDAINDYQGLFVCIAGNGNGTNINTNNSPDYPGSFNCDNQITVGSLNSNGSISSASNIGSTAVDIFAPDGSIWSTMPTTFSSTGYGYKSGSSMAAPHVAGAAALILAANPDLTTAQLRAAIMDSADEVAALSGNCVTGGRLNVYEAIKKVAFGTTNIGANNVRIDSIRNNLKQSITGSLDIPSTIRFRENGNIIDRTVTEIGNSVFANSSLSILSIPSSATRYNSYPENAGNSI